VSAMNSDDRRRQQLEHLAHLRSLSKAVASAISAIEKNDLRQFETHLAVHRGHALDVRGVLRRIHRGMNRLAIHVPVLQRDAEQGQCQNGRHDIGQIIDEVDAAGLDLLVEAGAGDVVDERFPALDRGRR